MRNNPLIPEFLDRPFQKTASPFNDYAASYLLHPSVALPKTAGFGIGGGTSGSITAPILDFIKGLPKKVKPPKPPKPTPFADAMREMGFDDNTLMSRRDFLRTAIAPKTLAIGGAALLGAGAKSSPVVNTAANYAFNATPIGKSTKMLRRNMADRLSAKMTETELKGFHNISALQNDGVSMIDPTNFTWSGLANMNRDIASDLLMLPPERGIQIGRANIKARHLMRLKRLLQSEGTMDRREFLKELYPYRWLLWEMAKSTHGLMDLAYTLGSMARGGEGLLFTPMLRMMTGPKGW